MKNILVVLVSFLVQPAMAITCHGTEPFWGAEITDSKVTLDQFGEVSERTVTEVEGASGFVLDFLKVYSNQRGPVAIVKTTTCSDNMSDFDYPQEVIIFTGESVLYGCCGQGVPIPQADQL